MENVRLFCCNVTDVRRLENVEKELKFLTTDEFCLKNNDGEDVVLFGQHFNVSLFENDVASAFDLIRLHVNKTQHFVGQNVFGVISSDSLNLIKWRSDVSLFFELIVTYLRSLHERYGRSVLAEEEIRKMLPELKGFLLDIGSLHNIPISKTINSKSNSSLVYFHVCLDIWWNSLKIFYLIFNYWPNLMDSCGDFVKNFDSLDAIDAKLTSFVKLLVYDLCLLDKNAYKSDSLNNAEPSLYPCRCVESFWLLLKRFVDFVSKEKHMCLQFSAIFRSVIGQIVSERYLDHSKIEIRSDQFLLPGPFQTLNINDKDLFYWKLVENLQILSTKINLEGIVLKEAAELVVKATVVKILNDQRVSIEGEQKLRRYLDIYLKICLLNPNCFSTIPEILLDSFCRHLNESFYAGGTLDDLSVIENVSAKMMLQKLKQLSTVENNSRVYQNKTSFELFLQILAIHCESDEKLTRSLRGRCFSKFHPGRVKDLSVRGLMNFFDLFLLLASKTGLIEVTDKIMEFVSEIDVKVTGFLDKLKIIIKSFVVLSMMFQEKHLDGSVCTSKLRLIFDSLLNLYTSSRQDSAVRRDVWASLMLFIQMTQELFANSDKFASGELQLLNILQLDSFLKTANLLDDIKQAHLSLIFKFWHTVANQANQLASDIWDTVSITPPKYPNELTVVFDAVCSKIIPAAKLFVFNINGSEIECNLDLWYSLTMATYFKNFKRINQDLEQMIDLYVWNSNISGSKVVQYIAKLLVNINLDPSKVVSMWLRCLFTVSGVNPILESLTTFVLKEYLSPHFSFNIPDDAATINFPNGCQDMFKMFCETIGSNLTIHTISVWRPVFDQPVKFAVEMLKKMDAVENFLHCNTVLATLVENCAYILHRRDDPKSNLKSILDQTILFNGKLNSMKEKEPKFRSINSTFARIVHGITKYPHWQTDIFLKNSLLEAYKLAFERTGMLESCKLASFNVKCLLDPLKDTFTESSLDLNLNSCNFRKVCVIKSVSDLLDKSFVSKNILTSILTFYSNLIESTRDERLVIDECKLLLPKFLIAWLRSDDSLTSLFVDTVVDTVCSKLIQVDNGQEIITGSMKHLLHNHLRQASDKVVRILKNMHRNAKIRSFINVKDLYSCELVELDRLTGGSLDPKLWTALDDLD